MFREVAAVDELDAQILDEELAQLLKQELIKVFPLEIPDWILQLLIYSKIHGSYGSDMMNIKYISTNWILYLLLKVVIPCALSTIHNKNFAITVKLVNFLHYVIYLIDGKYLYISHRILAIKAMYKDPLQPRLLNSEFITRQVIWQGFTDFAVFIAPFVNWIKIRNWTTTSRKYRDLPEDACALCLDKGYKSIKITNPYKTNCNHSYCYYCVKSEMLADSSWSCLICKSKVKSIKPKLDF
jgi:hypothetical protein